MREIFILHKTAKTKQNNRTTLKEHLHKIETLHKAVEENN